MTGLSGIFEFMNNNDINLRLFQLDNKGRGYTHDADAIIGLIFRCDMKTARDIVDRAGTELGIGTDPIVVLKTASPALLARITLETIDTNSFLMSQFCSSVPQAA